MFKDLTLFLLLLPAGAVESAVESKAAVETKAASELSASASALAQLSSEIAAGEKSGVAVELNASALAQISSQKVTDAMRAQAQKEGSEHLQSSGRYTLSDSALRAKVQAEQQKVEKARNTYANSASMSSMMEAHASMTQSQRLQEMSLLTEGGSEAIKSLSGEAKDALSGLQKMWMDVSGQAMERFTTIQANLPKGVEAMDPAKENAHKGAFTQIEEVVVPFMNHIKALGKTFPELNPWTNKVAEYSDFLQKDSLEDWFGGNLPTFKKYKKEFVQLKTAHQEHIMDFMEMFEMDDILTVLQSPEF